MINLEINSGDGVKIVAKEGELKIMKKTNVEQYLEWCEKQESFKCKK
jgi:hypothetical protein